MEEYKPKISRGQWWLIISVLLVIDLVQILLDFMAIGLVANSFIDIIVGMGFGLYLQMNGQSLAQPKRLFALLGTLGLEFIPLVNGLPLWVLDGLYNRHIALKRDEEMAKKAALASQAELQFIEQRREFLRQNAIQRQEFLNQNSLDDDIENAA